MTDFRNDILQFVSEFKTNAFYRSLAYGILFSAILTLILGGIVGVFEFTATFPYIKVQSQAYWVGIIFISFSFLFAFFGYMSDLNSREDILTPLRKKIVGNWEVRAQTWKIENGNITQGYVKDFCSIGIEDIGRKLIMHFEVRHSDIYKDTAFNITTIALGHQGDPRQLIYFYEASLQLRDSVASDSGAMDQIKFPFLGILNVEADGEINKMEGRWYDIDNSAYNLARRIPNLGGVEELRAAVDNGAVTFKGSLEFIRLKGPTEIRSGQ